MKGAVFIIDGSIAELNVDAIVNSAHASLLPGSGVSGIIHQAAGPELEEYCRQVGGCAIGDVVMTPGFGLPARKVIHAVTPKLRSGEELGDRNEFIWACLLKRIIELVCLSNVRSLAIPPLGVGHHHIPADFALPRIAEVAVAISEHLKIPIFLISRDPEHRRRWRDCLSALENVSTEPPQAMS